MAATRSRIATPLTRQGRVRPAVRTRCSPRSSCSPSAQSQAASFSPERPGRAVPGLLSGRALVRLALRAAARAHLHHADFRAPASENGASSPTGGSTFTPRRRLRRRRSRRVFICSARPLASSVPSSSPTTSANSRSRGQRCSSSWASSSSPRAAAETPALGAPPHRTDRALLLPRGARRPPWRPRPPAPARRSSW